jgi:hypothetical protein
MGHILHDWDLQEKRLLLEKAYEALPEGGALVIYEGLIDDERRENTFGLLMSHNILWSASSLSPLLVEPHDPAVAEHDSRHPVCLVLRSTSRAASGSRSRLTSLNGTRYSLKYRFARRHQEQAEVLSNTSLPQPRRCITYAWPLPNRRLQRFQSYVHVSLDLVPWSEPLSKATRPPQHSYLLRLRCGAKPFLRCL